MINRIRNILNLSNDIILTNRKLFLVQSNLDEIKVQNGKLASQINSLRKDTIIKNIVESEFKVFSQWGDDGIIDFLVSYLNIEQKTFIEFGVENYTEANTRFLLVNKNWKGLIMDGSESFMEGVKREKLFWQYDLIAETAFITAENINSLLSKFGFSGNIGLLHIDIDGNDYWIWKSIEVVNPSIVIVEFNSVFGIDKPWTVPYDSNFMRNQKHYSNLYYGTSLLSLCDLAVEKGYYFIGCNSNGNNAYFLRNDFKDKIPKVSISQGFTQSRFSESRDEKGQLTYLRGEERLKVLKGLKVYNTQSQKEELI
jgi:hypothetical protein